MGPDGARGPCSALGMRYQDLRTMGGMLGERLRLTLLRLDRLPCVMRCNNVFGIGWSLRHGLLGHQWQMGLLCLELW